MTKNIQDINRIEIQGRVGSCRITNVGDTRVARFSVATNFVYRDREGTYVIETTWHSVVAWEGKDEICNLDLITKGAAVNVKGRLRNERYTASDGSERSFCETYANSVTLLETETDKNDEDNA